MSVDNFDNELSSLYQQRKKQTQAPKTVVNTMRNIQVKRSPWHVVTLLLAGGVASFGIMAVVTHFAKPPTPDTRKQYQQHSVRIVELEAVIPQKQATILASPELPPQPESLSPKYSKSSRIDQEVITHLKPELSVKKVLDNAIAVPTVTTQDLDIEPIHRVMPEYPKSVLYSRKSGTVKLQYRISNQGKVVDVTVLSQQGSRLLERSAKQALTQWRYPQGSGSGEILEIEFEFKVAQ